MKVIDQKTGFYNAEYQIGYNMDRINYKVFLKEIMNLHADIACRNYYSATPQITDLSDQQKRGLIKLLIEADPFHSHAFAETENKIGVSFLHASSGQINAEEFIYYMFVLFCEYYTFEINQAFKYAESIEKDAEYWDNIKRRKAA